MVRPATITSPRIARNAEHQAKALELRRMGKGVREIGELLGLSKSHAHRLLVAGIESAREQVADNADELRAFEIDRLDAMLSSIWPRARRGELPAIDRVLSIQTRRARLLGLDAPEKREHTGPNGNPIPVASLNVSLDEYRRIAAEIAAKT